MLTWQEDMLSNVADESASAHAVFHRIVQAAQGLGFEYASYGIRVPMPMAAPEVLILDSYPRRWIERYVREDYVQLDPSVIHATKSQVPVLWHDLNNMAPEFWEDARGHGLAHGWAQATRDGAGAMGLLSLSRGGDRISATELADTNLQLQWLASLGHMALFRRLRGELAQRNGKLSVREIEVLKWSAAGKTNDEISDILNVSRDTIKFHIKNAMRKLNCFNKTQAVTHAALLGLLA